MQVSRDLGIKENSLYEWKKDYLSGRPNSVPGKGHLKPEQEELRKKDGEISRLIMQRDIVKKLWDTPDCQKYVQL